MKHILYVVIFSLLGSTLLADTLDSLRVTRAKPKDIPTIQKLMKENLGRNLSAKERREQGFVSITLTKEQLAAAIKNLGITVAKIGDEVIGYLIPMTLEERKAINAGETYNRLDALSIKSKPLKNYNYCVLTQVCIAKPFRGQGIAPQLYVHLKKMLRGKFDYMVGKVNVSNKRSQKVHSKLGFQTIHEHEAYGRRWQFIALNLRKK